MSLLRPLLPAAVAVAEVIGDRGVTPMPAGAPSPERATPARIAEFAAGRWCAQQALGALGVPVLPVPVGEHREPVWPAGVVGSITHSGAYRAAAVALTTALTTLGVDVEWGDSLLPAVADVALTPAERSRFTAGSSLASALQLAVFSAKESVFKAWFPRTYVWLDFADVTIDLSVPTTAGPAGSLRGTFTATPAAAAPDAVGMDIRQLAGRYSLVRGGAASVAYAWSSPGDPPIDRLLSGR